MTHDRKVSDQHTEKTVPATQRLAVRLFAGERIDITLVEGPQVADTWAFAGDDLAEYVSTAHTRSCIDRLTPRVGEAFYSNRRRPMLRIVEDSSPGVHDLLLSACDQGRYDLLGHTEPYRNCADNLYEALAALGLSPPMIPAPVNLFENVVADADGNLLIEPPPGQAGDFITLEAEMDMVIVVSACPMVIVATNGSDRRPKTVGLNVRPR